MIQLYEAKPHNKGFIVSIKICPNASLILQGYHNTKLDNQYTAKQTTKLYKIHFVISDFILIPLSFRIYLFNILSSALLDGNQCHFFNLKRFSRHCQEKLLLFLVSITVFFLTGKPKIMLNWMLIIFTIQLLYNKLSNKYSPSCLISNFSNSPKYSCWNELVE